MFPVKPSVTTTSAGPRRSSRLSRLPLKFSSLVAEERVRLERERIALLVLFADREQAHLRIRDVEQLAAEDRAHVRELEQVLGPGIGVRAGVEQHGRPLLGRDRDGDRRPHHAREPAQVQQPGGEHRTGVAGGDDRVGIAAGDRADRGDEARVGLRPDGLGRLLGHLDPLGRLDQRQALRVETRRAEEDDVDPVGGSVERAEDHLVGCLVSPERVDRDAGHVR